MNATAYVFRFVNLLRKRECKKGPLTIEEISRAEISLTKQDQNIHFNLMSKITKQSTLHPLCPMIGSDSLIRSNSRLCNSDLTYDEKYPIILSNRSELTRLIVIHYHKRFAHASARFLLTQLRSKYWIIRGLSTIKRILHDECYACKKQKAKPFSEEYASLPEERVHLEEGNWFPFVHCGIDHAGPFSVKLSPSSPTIKSYILLITCAVSRAVHLESVLSLNNEATTNALERFIYRRGIPKIIRSDNFSTFKSISRVLEKRFNLTWRFNTELAPWHGGYWERLVGCLKGPLKRELGRSVFTHSEFTTILCKVEALVNSRPITLLPSASEDSLPLTPAHFLVGRSLLALPSGTPHLDDANLFDLRRCFTAKEKATKAIWSRWRQEYLLMIRHVARKEKCRSIELGDVVLLDSQGHKSLWPLAIVEKLFFGKDGKARTAIIRCEGRELRRPIQKLYFFNVCSRWENVAF